MHLVDCGSTDGSLEWVLRRCRAAIEEGVLQVYTVGDRLPFWHASVGKNTAHMVADQDILVNVDSDNLIGKGFPEDVVTRNKIIIYYHANGIGPCLATLSRCCSMSTAMGRAVE